MTDSEKKKAVLTAFKIACLGAGRFPDLLAAAGLDAQAVASACDKYAPAPTCRGCSRPVTADDFAVWTSYWKGIGFPSHVVCREPGMREEAYECQLIDADCNDCKHFRRKAGNAGECGKTGLPVVANPVFCTGMPCFEHRKAPPA